MNLFRHAAPRSPLELLSMVVPAKPDMSHSSNLFFVLVCGAGAAWLLAMFLWMGGWKKISPYLPKGVSIGSVSGFALLAIFALLFAVYRGENRGHPARAAMTAPQAPRTPQVTLRAAVAKTPTPGPNPVAQKRPEPETPMLKPGAAAPSASLPALQPQVSAAAPAAGREAVSAAAGIVTPPMHTSATHLERQPRDRAPLLAIASTEAEASRRSALSPSPSPQLIRPVSSTHSIRALSDAQSRQVCGAVSPYAGTDVYIKWSPGSNTSQFANQLAKVMDCARVTVTFAGESKDFGSRGVRVGTHADEGQTSERIEPFAEAVAEALREQGFSVAEVTGPNIPANQTAIFIGSD